MKRKFVQIAALCLVLACILTVGGQAFFNPDSGSGSGSGTGGGSGTGWLPPTGSTPSTNPSVGQQIVRAGIYYGNDTLDGANLANSVGSGFLFGYYDSSNVFYQLGYTDETAISVVKTENVYYGTYNGYASYHDNITSNVAVGCYHLQIPGAYTTFEAAKNVAAQYADGFAAYIGGVYYARVGSYTTRDQAVSAQSSLAEQGVTTELAGTSAYGVNVVKTKTSTILFQYDDEGNGTGLGLEPISADGSKCETIFKNRIWYGGFRYERINGGDLTIVGMVALDDYVKGVIPYEMSPSWEAEALKALAVCARNYAIYNKNRHKSYHFDVCNNACCQVYLGIRHATTGAGATQHTDTCVDETAGVMVYYNGNPIGCYFYSSNGGASEDSSVVWTGKQESFPYLLGVIDPYEATVADQIPNYSWTREFTQAELTSYVRDKGYNCSTIVSAYTSQYTDTGNPKTVTFVDANGRSYTLNTRKFVGDMNLRSYNYDFGTGKKPTFSINGTASSEGMSGLYALDGNGNTVAVSEGAYVITSSGTTQTSTGNNGSAANNGKILVSGKGWGHNVGLSQWGARAMAKLGYTYDQILTFYYTGVTVG